MLEKIGGGLIIPDRGRMEGQTAGILVETEHHHSRFVCGDLYLLLHEEMGHDRNGRPDRFDNLQRAFQAALLDRVMIVNMDIDTGALGHGGEWTDPRSLANINEDQAGHSIKVDVAGSFEAEGILGAVEEEFAQTALLTAGEDHFGIGIQTPGGNHRPEAIKIGIDVGRDDVHVENLRFGG